jgi:hypothetical protein
MLESIGLGMVDSVLFELNHRGVGRPFILNHPVVYSSRQRTDGLNKNVDFIDFGDNRLAGPA